MHSLVDSCTCPDRRLNPQPWCISRTLHTTEHPGQGPTLTLLTMVFLKDYWKAFLLKYSIWKILKKFKASSNFVCIVPLMKRNTTPPWPVWLSRLGSVPQTERSQVPFLVRAPASLQVWPQVGACKRGNRLAFLSLPFSLPPPHSKNKNEKISIF